MDPITPQPQEQPQYQSPISSQKHFLNKKFIVTFVILILLGTGSYAGIWYWQNQQVAQEAVPTFTPRPSASATPDISTWKTYTGTSFEVKYPENIFTMFDVRKYSGAQYKRNLTEVELISSSRASNIGKKECAFSGLLGQVSSNQLCELGRESGISFTETDGPISDYTSVISESAEKTTVTIGGKQFIKSRQKFPDCTYPKDANGEKQKVCTDGVELDIYYIALNANRTLMVFRHVEGAHYYPQQLDGFPQQNLVDQILSTFKFTK